MTARSWNVAVNDATESSEASGAAYAGLLMATGHSGPGFSLWCAIAATTSVLLLHKLSPSDIAEALIEGEIKPVLVRGNARAVQFARRVVEMHEKPDCSVG